MSNYCLLLFIIVIFLWDLGDLWYNKEEAFFKEKTLNRLRLKDTSFIRKFIPFKVKEGMVKNRKGKGHYFHLSALFEN